MIKVAKILRPGRAILVSALIAFVPPAFANHSFNVNSASVIQNGGQVLFSGGPTAPSALGLSFTGMVCNLANSTVFVGNSHTFTSVGEQFNFVVPVPQGTFSPGEQVIIATSETSTADCNAGGEGFEAALTLHVNTAVPTLHEFALLLVALMLAMVGMRRLRRS